MNTVPTPNSQRVTIDTLTNIKVAVKTFRGSSNKAAQVYKQLKKQIKQDELNSTDEWYLCQYNSPWVFPLLRKNEIWVKLKN